MFSKDPDFWEMFEEFNFKKFFAVVGGVALATLIGSFLFVWGWNTRDKQIEVNKAKPRKVKDPIDVEPEAVVEKPVSYVKTPDPGLQTSNVVSLQSENALTVRAVPSALEMFHHSEDFRVINLPNQKFELTLNQGRVIEKLWEAKENQTPEMHQSALLEGLEIYSKRIRDVFKNNMTAFKVLIGRGKRKGMFRLNVA